MATENHVDTQYMQNGPRVRIVLQCYGCQHFKDTAKPEDWGRTLACSHACREGQESTIRSPWDSPAWCPVRGEVVLALQPALTNGPENQDFDPQDADYYRELERNATSQASGGSS